MRDQVLRREQVLPVGVAEAFEFFSRAENLEAITPPFLRFRITTPAPIEMRAGSLIRYRLRLRGIPIRWLTRIEEWAPPDPSADGERADRGGFVDQQLKGPYALWHHTHSFVALGESRTRMVDIVRYRQRLGALGALANPLVRRNLDRIFDFRRDSIAELIAARS